MKNRYNRLAVITLLCSSWAFASNWQIDPAHSTASFSIRHMMISNVRGEFGKVTGSVNWDEADVTKSTAEATIDTTTINTHEPKRDQHLKSPDFFDVAKYPTITFKSKSVKKAGADRLTITGDLTMHGVTKPVTLEATYTNDELKDPWGNTRRGASARTKLNRKDFDLKWNQTLESGGVLVGDEVDITLDLELIKKAANKT
jgi:polyisoprenoid-binding protein YceI